VSDRILCVFCYKATDQQEETTLLSSTLPLNHLLSRSSQFGNSQVPGKSQDKSIWCRAARLLEVMPSPYNSKTAADEVVSDLTANIKGKIILTTGVSPGGLGAFFVESIAKAEPALLILAGRNVTKLEATADAIKKNNPGMKTRLLQLDLESLDAVRKSADTVNGWDIDHIDVLVNNAGIVGLPIST
jgi:short chain dehydrogenase